MLLLGLALVAFGVWLWFRIRKSGRKVPAAWLGIAGTLIGTVLVAKGMPVVGGLVATTSGLWLRFGGTIPGKDQPPEPARNPVPTRGEISRTEAADLLGLPLNASRDEIIAAHRSLITRNHPDVGGSAGLAARINAARDVLLNSQEK